MPHWGLAQTKWSGHQQLPRAVTKGPLRTHKAQALLVKFTHHRHRVTVMIQGIITETCSGGPHGSKRPADVCSYWSRSAFHPTWSGKITANSHRRCAWWGSISYWSRSAFHLIGSYIINTDSHTAALPDGGLISHWSQSNVSPDMTPPDHYWFMQQHHWWESQ